MIFWQCFALVELNRKLQARKPWSCIHKCQSPRAEHDREVETMDLGKETENIAIINILYDHRKFKKKKKVTKRQGT